MKSYLGSTICSCVDLSCTPYIFFPFLSMQNGLNLSSGRLSRYCSRSVKTGSALGAFCVAGTDAGLTSCFDVSGAGFISAGGVATVAGCTEAGRPSRASRSFTRTVSIGWSSIVRQLMPAKVNRYFKGISEQSIMYGRREFFFFSLKAKVISFIVNLDS